MRRKAAPKRDLLPDPKYGDQTLTKFVNCIMCDGKKSLAEKIIYNALEIAQKRLEGKSFDVDEALVDKDRPLQIMYVALDKVRPLAEVKSRRVGGATYQVPIEVRKDRGISLAMRWLSDAAKKRSEKKMAERLASEISEACQDRGAAVKKREDTHRMAQANKAFAHFRW
ncbi:MAG: 30S ribosomal protein S7 [Pseudomonadota bacterium]